MIKKVIAILLVLLTLSFGITASPTFHWVGATDTEGKVVTGSTEDTGGYWYKYDDNSAPNNGDSKITFPADVEENAYENFFGPLCEKYGGIKAEISIGPAYEYGFAGFGFNIWSENQEGVDITAWNGICLAYSSTANFAVELGVEDEGTVTGYNNYKAAVSKGTGAIVDLPWVKFKQESSWGTIVAQSEVLEKTAAIKLKFTANSDILISQIGSLGQCTNDGTPIKSVKKIEPISIKNNTVSFVKPQNVGIFDVTGALVKSVETTSLNMSTFKPGLYIIMTNDLTFKFLVK